MRHKRPASDTEVAEHLGISMEDLDRKLSLVGQSAILSLEEMVDGMGESVASPLSRLSGDDDPASDVQAAETRRLLAEAVNDLPERERLVITLYYYEELTLKEIASVLEVTESRVSQMHTRAILRLSGKLAADPELFSLAA
jgi:RNA polymerase sigma factor for flagellar operon FliA